MPFSDAYNPFKKRKLPPNFFFQIGNNHTKPISLYCQIILLAQGKKKKDFEDQESYKDCVAAGL